MSKLSPETLALLARGEHPDYHNMHPEELEALGGTPSKPPAYTKMESAGKGALQGATLGFGDEIGGLIQSGLDAGQALGHTVVPSIVGPSPTQVSQSLKDQGFKGDIGPTSERQMYRKAQGENQKENEEAEVANPKSYLGGELAGGIGGASLTAGVGPELMAARGAGAASTDIGAQGLRTILAEEGLGSAAGEAAKRAGVSAVNAAPVGAAYGAGMSKGSLVDATPEEKLQMLKDTGKGALTGSLVGAGTDLAVQAAKPAMGGLVDKLGGLTEDMMAKNPYLRQLNALRQMGKEGIDTSSELSQMGSLAHPGSLDNPLDLQDTQAANSILEKINMADDHLGGQVGEVINTATEQGLTVPIGPELQQAAKGFVTYMQKDASIATNPQVEKLTDMMFRMQKEDLTPLEVQTLRNDISNFGRKMQGKDNFVASEAFDFAGKLGQKLKEEVPGYQSAAERLYDFRKNIPETLLSKDSPTDVTNMRVSGTRNVDMKLLGRIKDTIRGMGIPGASNDIDRGTFTNFLRGLQDLSEKETNRVQNGEVGQTIFDTIGMQPQDIEQAIKAASDKSAAVQRSQGLHSSEKIGGSLGSVLNMGKSSAAYGANKLGLAQRAISNNKPSTMIDKGKLLYNASDDTLKDFSRSLMSLPGNKELSDALNRAIDRKDMIGKNAVLFTIMQNPNLRPLIDSANLTPQPSN